MEMLSALGGAARRPRERPGGGKEKLSQLFRAEEISYQTFALTI